MLTVTVEAQEKLKETLESSGSKDAPVRIDVVRGPHGCVHDWKLAVADGQAPSDIEIEAGPVRVLYESSLSEMLEGATIRYSEDLSGIGFTVDAPNAPEAGHGHQGGGGDGGGCGCHHGH